MWWMLACEPPPEDRPAPTTLSTPSTVPARFWTDGDRDGYGDPAVFVDAAAAPAGFVSNADDCDDGDPAVHPDAGEDCAAGDADCDGLDRDDDPDLTDGSTFYADPDGDGRGDPAQTVVACEAPEGYVALACGPTLPLDWVDGLDQDGVGGVDGMPIDRGGLHVAWMDEPDLYPRDVAHSSVTLDVEGDGSVDWFVVATTAPFAAPTPSGTVDGLFRIDDVRCFPPSELVGAVPHLTLPGAQRVYLWEDTTGDGVPELLVTSQLSVLGPLPLTDVYLLDPTTTAASGAIEDLALLHFVLPAGVHGPVGDFDGDGRPELVYTDLDLGYLGFLGTLPVGGAPIVPDAEIAIPPYWKLPVAADLNGDGADDLAVPGLQRVVYGGPALGGALEDYLLLENHHLVVADFDGDGLDDVATTFYPPGSAYEVPYALSIHYGSASGLAAAPDRVVDLGVSNVRGGYVGDVDGGGAADVLLHEFDEGAVLFRGEDDFTSEALVFAPPYGGYTAVTWGPVLDVDLDGYAEVLVRNVASYGVDAGTSTVVFWGERAPAP